MDCDCVHNKVCHRLITCRGIIGKYEYKRCSDYLPPDGIDKPAPVAKWKDKETDNFWANEHETFADNPAPGESARIEMPAAMSKPVEIPGGVILPRPAPVGGARFLRNMILVILMRYRR